MSTLAKILIALFLSPTLVACTGSSSAPTPTPTPAPDEPEESVPDGPNIISLNTSAPILDDRSNVVVSAIVTDPQGVEDLIGGELITPAGTVLGVFATAAQEGAYAMNINWITLKPTIEITAEETGELPIVLTAAFYDQAGHRSTKSVALTLACSVEGKSPCSGFCVNLSRSTETIGNASYNNCGACGNSCGAFVDLIQSTSDSLRCTEDAEYTHPVSCGATLHVSGASVTCEQFCATTDLPVCDSAGKSLAGNAGFYWSIDCNNNYTRNGVLIQGEPTALECSCRQWD